jgi:serine/threonine-protein kinase RsbW/stage II sporulation protein AB (anti-sigma F factor)
MPGGEPGNATVMGRWQGRFRARPEAARIIRSEVAARARDWGVPDASIGDVKLAVTEAATNVVLHAYRDGAAGDVGARAQVEPGRLRVVISDEGCGLAPRSDSPGLGLGLPLITAVAETVEVIALEQGTEIHMTFPCSSDEVAA